MLETTGLTKRYGELVAVDALDLHIGAGEVVGFLGPNGAGKTTTLRMLTGMLPASAGSARIGGHDVFESPMQIKRLIGYLPEVPPLYPDLTGREYLRFVATLKGVPTRRLRGEVERVAERVELGAALGRLTRNLSKGYQQRLGLAQALLGSPPVLILDEPTVGLDPRQICAFRALICALAGEHTVLYSSHTLAEVRAICPRVVVLCRGRVVADDGLAALVARHRAGGGEASLEQIFLALTEI